MNAKQAREKADSIHLEKETGQLARIRKLIEKAVAKGEYDVWCYEDSIEPVVKKKLEADGYSVNTQFERNETMTSIKW